MVKCPNCRMELENPKKRWKYAQFVVHAYSCNCGAQFRDYIKNGKRSFILKFQKGKGFVRA